MLHSIYIVVKGNLVDTVFVNHESGAQRSDMSVCVVHLDKDAEDAPEREYVDDYIRHSTDLTEVLVEYPNYENIKEAVTQTMREEL